VAARERTPNQRLRRARLLRGWSQEFMAAELRRLAIQVGERPVAVTGEMVGTWERGEKQPRAPYPRLLCLLFQASAADLGLLLEGASTTIQASVTLDDMDRRTVLKLLAAAVLTPVLHHRGAPPSLPGRGQQATLETVAAGIADCRRTDDCLGALAAVRPTLTQRDTVGTLLAHPHPDRLRYQLISARGQLDQLAAWLAFDLGDQATAQAYLRQGLAAAHEAGDEPLGAYLLGHRAVLAAGDDVHEALAFAAAAQARARRSATDTTHAWLAAVNAELQGLAGDATGCLRSLDAAEAALDRASLTDDPAWIYYFGRTELDTYKGACYEQLGRPAAALATWQSVLASLDASLVRDRSFYLTHLAATYMQEAELEQACRLAAEALAVAVSTRSRRGLERVRGLRQQQLAPWRATSPVKALDEQLAHAWGVAPDPTL
jgi:transcriptional regulator with XRE-family HTH domain